MSGQSRDEGRARRVLAALDVWLGVALAVVAAVLGNVLARRHLDVRRDVSEDGLYALSDSTRSILAGLEDRLSVKAYFTGEVMSGEVALLKARLEGLLEELQDLARGRMSVTVVDPSRASEVLLEAEGYGIRPRTVTSFVGTNQVRQQVYLGLVLRYRGREEVLPFVDPWRFETLFASRVHALKRDRRVRVGWLGAESSEAAGSFGRVQGVLERTGDLVRVEGLETGLPVPADLDLLLVVRPPRRLDPRAVFEIDQFVQRGGQVVFALDDVAIGAGTWRGELTDSGLAPLLAPWGARLLERHVWDEGRHARLPVRKAFVDGDGRQAAEVVRVEYPLWVEVAADGFARSVAATAGLRSALLPWVQPIDVEAPPPAGVERTVLVASTDDAWDVELVREVRADPELLSAQRDALLASGAGRSRALAVLLEGRFPTPFDRGAPAPWTPEGDSRGIDRAAPVLSGQSDARVVVFGDADWLRDAFFTPENEVLLANLVDWLSLDEELIRLRSRAPRERPLRDFLAEERERVGLGAPIADTAEEIDLWRRREAAARAAAGRRRRLAMALPVGVSLGVVAAFGLAWNLSQRAGRGRSRAGGGR